MDIKTKFKVSDLVEHKFQKSMPHVLQAIEITEITTKTCYAGTQVFYDGRYVVLRYHPESFSEKEAYWTINYGCAKEDLKLGWSKFREDELVKAQDKILEAIKNKDNEEFIIKF